MGDLRKGPHKIKLNVNGQKTNKQANKQKQTKTFTKAASRCEFSLMGYICPISEHI